MTYLCRDEDGRVLADVFYTDEELAAMPHELMMEYLRVLDAREQAEIDRYLTRAGFLASFELDR